jgi:hypothetical protein
VAFSEATLRKDSFRDLRGQGTIDHRAPEPERILKSIADPKPLRCAVRSLRYDQYRARDGGIAVKQAIIAAVLLSGLGLAEPAHAAGMQPQVKADAKSCLVQVLYSEEIPLGPMFFHTVKATLLVTPPDRPPFQTTIEKVTPWQVPPPRQGQQTWVYCDAASLNAFPF